MELEDELVYTALVGSLYEKIYGAVGWAQGDPDVSYQLEPNGQAARWVKSDFTIWREWRQKSLDRLHDGVQFVLFADIVAFYENIDLRQLGYDLRDIGAPDSQLELLNTCLRRWSGTRHKGIPQGYSASDILAKIFLRSVDQGLHNFGFQYLRYVDDVRIFCRTRLEAKQALLALNDLLRCRGLNLQTAKTEIVNIEKARHLIDGVAPIIDSIQTQLSREMDRSYVAVSGYASISDIERLAERDPDSPALEVLERAFQEHLAINSQSGTDFDKTLFRYVINRLGKAKSRIGVEYCLNLLASRPEETEAILHYLQNVGATSQDRLAVLKYANSPDAIYDYQIYQIVCWFLKQRMMSPEVIALCRQLFRDQNRKPWVRSVSLAVIGLGGDAADLESLESAYCMARSDIERAEIVSTCARMDSARRNAFYNRVKNDCDLVRRAVRAVRGGQIPDLVP